MYFLYIFVYFIYIFINLLLFSYIGCLMNYQFNKKHKIKEQIYKNIQKTHIFKIFEGGGGATKLKFIFQKI